MWQTFRSKNDKRQDIDRFEGWKKKERENDKKRETHLHVSVVTDRLRVSSSVSASRVRHRWASTRPGLWVLQQLGNWKPHGLSVSKGLRWHTHKKKCTHWFNAKKNSSDDERATQRPQWCLKLNMCWAEMARRLYWLGLKLTQLCDYVEMNAW